MKALQIYAGPGALAQLADRGLQPADVAVIPAAAGGPKGLILGPLDRFIFGQWLPQSTQAVHLVGASIGAWRMATACLPHAIPAFERLEHDYIHQHYPAPPGRKRPLPEQISENFARSLEQFYGGQVNALLAHPRYRLHIVTSRGRHLLGAENGWRTPLGYAGAFLTNAVRRKAMGAWLERVVFSGGGPEQLLPPPLPFATHDYRTRQVALTRQNFMDALQASCSIPFVLRAVPHINGAPRGAYWDGGITDYHLHLDYRSQPGLVLYPHFQQAVVPGWLDKPLKWRHSASPFLDRTVVLAPRPEWVATLPHGKLPTRQDFEHYHADVPGRIRVWNAAVAAACQLADELAEWLQRPDMAAVRPL